jgi:hypothetical protein
LFLFFKFSITKNAWLTQQITVIFLNKDLNNGNRRV